jgi:hypothetical protein
VHIKSFFLPREQRRTYVGCRWETVPGVGIRPTELPKERRGSSDGSASLRSRDLLSVVCGRGVMAGLLSRYGPLSPVLSKEVDDMKDARGAFDMECALREEETLPCNCNAWHVQQFNTKNVSGRVAKKADR